MAKIKQFKQRLQLNGPNDYKETVVEICYDNSKQRYETKGRFFIKLPKIVADAMGITEVRAADQDKVIDVFDETLKNFKALQTETNMVILYQIDTSSAARENSWNSGWNGIMVRVWAGTFKETVSISGAGAKRYSYEPVESSLKYPFHPNAGLIPRDGEKTDYQIPWTPENEKFFLWVQTSMTALADQLQVLRKTDALIETINAGRLLPMGKTPQESIF
jgi:hypothetical protein